MLPTLNSQDLQPWLVLRTQAGDSELACWRISATDEAALAIFSSREKAETYGMQTFREEWRSFQPSEQQLLQCLIDAYRSNMSYVVLDPFDDTARSLYSVRDVLRAAQERIQQNRL